MHKGIVQPKNENPVIYSPVSSQTRTAFSSVERKKTHFEVSVAPFPIQLFPMRTDGFKQEAP